MRSQGPNKMFCTISFVPYRLFNDLRTYYIVAFIMFSVSSAYGERDIPAMPAVSG